MDCLSLSHWCGSKETDSLIRAVEIAGLFVSLFLVRLEGNRLVARETEIAGLFVPFSLMRLE